MNLFKRLIAVLLAAVLILSLAACGADSSKPTSAGEKTPTEAAKPSDEKKPAATEKEEPEEYPVIRVNYHCIFDTWEAVDEVQDALN